VRHELGLFEQAALAEFSAQERRQNVRDFVCEHVAIEPIEANQHFLLNLRKIGDPSPVSVPALMRELGNSPRGVSEGGA
jgi:hypothetical protein